MESFSKQGELYTKSVIEKVKPEDRESLQRIVLAGQKIMFAKETHKYMQDILNKEGDIVDRLGVGIVELMGLLVQQSKGNLPPQLIIPAGSLLLLKACEFVERSGEEMNMDIFSEAVKVMSAGIHKQASDMVERQKGQQPGQPESAPVNPEQAGQPAQQPGQPGLIGA